MHTFVQSLLTLAHAGALLGLLYCAWVLLGRWSASCGLSRLQALGLAALLGWLLG